MRLLSQLVITLALSFTAAQAASIQLEQNGWTTGATFSVAFSGQDANQDGALLQSELSSFNAVWLSPIGISTTWGLSDIEPDGFSFTDTGNYLFFTRNDDFSLVSSAFEGEALASVFDASLFPVDSTATSATTVPEPSGLLAGGLAALVLWRWRRK